MATDAVQVHHSQPTRSWARRSVVTAGYEQCCMRMRIAHGHTQSSILTGGPRFLCVKLVFPSAQRLAL